MGFTYDLQNLINAQGTVQSQKDQVRFLIGDTKSKDPLLDDEEVFFSLSLRASIWGAAAMCCEAIADKFSREADTVEGQMRTQYSSRARAYHARARTYEMKAAASGGITGYSGGISWPDKIAQEMDVDRVPGEFVKGMDDNFIPVAPAGPEGEEPEGSDSGIF